MLCFMCYYEIQGMAMQVYLDEDTIVYICQPCLEDLNLEEIEEGEAE